MSTFAFIKKYEKWLEQNGVNSSGAYCPQDKFVVNETKLLFLDLIGIFAYKQEYFYVSALFEKWKSEINKEDKSQKTILNRYYYLNKYKQFIETEVYGKEPSKEDKDSINEDLLSCVRNAINQSQNPKVDGMDSLVSFIDEKQFIKLAIESSYFFSSELVKTRFEEIKDYISQKKETDPAFNADQYDVKYLPARYSQKEDDKKEGIHNPDENEGKVYFCVSDKTKPLCVIYQEGARGKNKMCNGKTCGGGNGNARVCQLIKNRTGYDLGAPSDKKHFRNFIISHIWGHAIDPRYFTNLWNIVLVPAWANHLLDKEEKGTLASTFKATIKKVITKCYGLAENYDWEAIEMDCPTYEEEETLDGNNRFQINIIKELNKENNKLFGDITKQIVKLD